MSDKAKKIINITGYVLAGVIFLIALFMMIVVFSTEDGKPPKLFNKYVLSVQSDSMKGVFEKGDLVICDVYTGEEDLSEAIITYKTYKDNKAIYNTHKVSEIKLIGGKTYYVTVGVNPSLPDSASETVSEDSVIGIYNYKISGLGGAVDFFKSPLGFFLIFVLPMLLFFIYRLYVVIKLIVEVKKEKNKPSTPEDVDKLLGEIAQLKARLEEKDGTQDNK